METKWYETQIIGVIVGGLITLVANWFYRWNESRIEKNNLKAGINAEISVFFEFTESVLKTIQKTKKEFESKGSIFEVKMTGVFEFNFIDSNMSKLSIVGGNLLKKIIELKGLCVAYIEGSKIIFDEISVFNKSGCSKSALMLSISQAEGTMKRIKELCDEIIHLTNQ